MPVYEFTITAPATVSARVKVEAATLEQAHEKALSEDFYSQPDNARFELDEGNVIDDVYLPDPDEYEVEEEASPAPIGR